MKQDSIIEAYKNVVEAFNNVDARVRDMTNLLPDAPVEGDEKPGKMVTPDMNKCLYIGATYLEDARLRINAVFTEMLRYSDEFVAQQMAAQAEAQEQEQAPADPAPNFKPQDAQP